MVAIKAIACAFPAQALAAEPASKLPRYYLEVGQELQYHEQSQTNYGAAGPADGDSTDWQAWVVGANGNGSWRALIRCTSHLWSKAAKAAKRTEYPQQSAIDFCDVFPDGRLLPHDPLNTDVAPEKIFPALPLNRTALRRGWTSQSADGFTQFECSAALKKPAGDSFVFDQIERSAYDKAYGTTGRDTITFDSVRGIVEHVDSQSTRAWYTPSKTTSEIKFVAVKNHDPAWCKKLAGEAEIYFKATDADNACDAADRASSHAAELLAAVESGMKAARAQLTEPILVAQLDQQISAHERMAKFRLEACDKMSERKGKTAPDWKLADLDGKSHSLSDYRGQVVVLDFWHRGCGWCIRAMPQVQQLADEFNGKDVAILGITLDEMDLEPSVVVEAMGLRYPNLLAKEMAKPYGVTEYPTIVVIDKKGIVREYYVGYSKTLREDVSKIITDLLRK